jgi:hypothetical protein
MVNRWNILFYIGGKKGEGQPNFFTLKFEKT